MAFFPEELFSTLLLLERKRCERAGTRFGLGLLDVGNVADPGPVMEMLCSQVRETDIAGWYQEDKVLGAIFTTLDGAPIASIRKSLNTKIKEVVGSEIPFKLFIFPEDITKELFPEVFAPKKRKAAFHRMKRMVDIGVSLAALTALSPVIIAIVTAIKMTSPGPVFFRQKRLGLLGKEFEFLKFRSMHVDNNPEIHKKYVESLIQGKQNGAGVYKIQNDPRVTKLGRFLRRYSLDELPQFINVLKGEMSLVGPRPPIPYEIEQYSSWHRRRVFEVRPGITGLWQVYGRSRTTFDEMVRLDIRYINEQSPWLDFKILIQTPRAVLSASGAY
jgi:lipopolysaccharide/colanic/teichoic acid biosynthesis glycosyltransferase